MFTAICENAQSYFPAEARTLDPPIKVRLLQGQNEHLAKGVEAALCDVTKGSVPVTACFTTYRSHIDRLQTWII